MSRPVSPVIRHVPLTQARASLGTIVNDVNRNSEYVVVERGGLPVAVIIDFDEFEDYLDLRDPAVQERIAEASREHRAGKSLPAEDLIPRLQRATAAGRRRKKAVPAKE
jgi:prevent-host-death family protein